MTFTVNTLARCPGQNHYQINLTFAGGATVTANFSRDEMVVVDPRSNLIDAHDAILARLSSAIKEANANTFALAKTAIEGKTFKV